MRKVFVLIISLLLMTGCNSVSEIPDLNITTDYSKDYYDTHEIYTVYENGEAYTVIKPKAVELKESTIVLPLHMQYLKGQISLSEFELLIYLRTAFNDFNSVITLDKAVTEEELSKVYNLYLNNELGVTVTNAIRYKISDGYVKEIYPEYSYSKNNLSRLNFDIKDKVDSVKQEIDNADLSDYEKVKYIHDYIISNCVYEKGSNANDLYGVLFTRRAVCEGYAKAFSYFCDLYDIESMIVTGTTDDNHMWNKVKLEGVWYNIDLTWDDADNVLSYDYFLISDTAISKTHTQDNRFKYPEALVDYVGS